MESAAITSQVRLPSRSSVARSCRCHTSALRSVGATFDDVVNLTVYCTDLDTQLPTVAAYRSRYFSEPVVSTTLQVSRLVRPEWLLEIEAAVVLS